MNVHFEAPQIITVVGFVFILLELYVGVGTSVDLLIFGLILCLSGAVTPNLFMTFILFVILSTCHMLFGRKLIDQKLIKILSKKPSADKIVGATGTVIKHTSAIKTGLVQLGNDQWRATSNDEIRSGTKVTVLAIEGITLVVEPVRKIDLL